MQNQKNSLSLKLSSFFRLKQKKVQLRVISLEAGTSLNCDCRSAWLKDHWKRLKLEASNEIVRFFIARFSIHSLNDHFYRPEKESTAGQRFAGKSQLEDLFIKQSNLTYEQLIELNLNRIANFEQNLDQVKCREQVAGEPADGDLFLVKGVDEKFDAHHFANNKFNLNYLAKIERRKANRKQSVLDAFQHSMRSCLRSSAFASRATNLFNEINYLASLGGCLLASVLVQKFIASY